MSSEWEKINVALHFAELAGVSIELNTKQARALIDTIKQLRSYVATLEWLEHESEIGAEQVGKQIEDLEAENARLRAALEFARLEMIRFGNVAEWPPEMSMTYAEAINGLRDALKGGE